ncbi:transcriptional regulator family: Fungal Specific TF [Penicillium taxi]|uniref:transcriptional regulator family: Fungal Specific TF n=1 Tax=Penicillium taxi TaxID=168475 RepID=UPI002545340E|nr:transcriptional regulator family: Fungal Specific TF [Penicillium taxi]KAJ5901520.1 transcriptional regulator family: Fungal Specific TF [Penicillium taxi]
MSVEALRAVRCDRQSVCANCIDSGQECLRLRPDRPLRRKAPSAISTLGERILKLESAFSQPNGGEESIPSNTTNQGDYGRPSKRKRFDQLSETRDSSKSPHGNRGTITPDDSTHHAEHAKFIIQSELYQNDNINHERQVILKAALEFMNSMTQDKTSGDDFPPLNAPCDGHDGRGGIDGTPESISPSPELIYMLLEEQTFAAENSQSIIWPSHISKNTFKKMALVLLDGEAKGQLFYQYCICVYQRAIGYMYQMPRVHTEPRIEKHFFKSKKLYEARSLHALANLNFLNNPSLPLVQSLISAALLMQCLGNTSQAWVFTSYAARLIIALKYHEFRDTAAPLIIDEDIRSCLFWCYCLDRSLSSVLRRPLSLPDLPVSPAKLIGAETPLPYAPLIRMIINMAEVQGSLLSCKDAGDTRQIISSHTFLQDRMFEIYSESQSSRAAASEFLDTDWIAIDFCYHSILVDILRSRLRYAFSPLTHRECVAYARKSLKSLNSLQKFYFKGVGMPGFTDPFPSFLTWTVLYYPLSPFFVLFCNIIGELELEDYNLIQEVTQSLSHFSASPYIAKLLKLLDSLLGFCIPLIQAKERLDQQNKAAPTYPSMNGQDNWSGINDGLVSAENSYMDPVVDLNLQQMQSLSDENYPMTDGLMQNLFNSQLSLEWLESDLFSSENMN